MSTVNCLMQAYASLTSHINYKYHNTKDWTISYLYHNLSCTCYYVFHMILAFTYSFFLPLITYQYYLKNPILL